MPTKLPHITDDHHFAIANVAARSSQMNVHIEKIIEAAFRTQPKTAAFLLKNLGTDRIVALAKAVLLDAMPDEEPRIDNLIKTIADLRSERNEILHSSWIPGMEPDTAISASARPHREFRYKSRTAAEVQEIADEMLAVSHVLMGWRTYLHERRTKPSPDKHGPPAPPTSSPSP